MSAIATMLAGTAIKGAMGAAQGIFGAKKQRKEMDYAAQQGYKYNEMAAEEAHRRQKENMGMLYEMNSPENMRKRMEEAGLSVGLMYGGGGGAGGAAQASTAPQGGGTGGVNPVNLSEIKQANTQQSLAMAQEQVMAAQAENIKADTDLKKSQIGKTGAETDFLKIQGVSEQMKQKFTQQQTEWQEIQNKIANQTAGAEVQKVWQEVRGMKANAEKMIAETKGINIDNETRGEMNQAIIDNYNAQVEKAGVEMLLIESQNKLTRIQCEKVVAEIADIYRQQSFELEKIDNTRTLIQEMKRHNLRTEGLEEVNQVLHGGEIAVDIFKSFIPFATKTTPKKLVHSKKETYTHDGTTYTDTYNRYR